MAVLPALSTRRSATPTNSCRKARSSSLRRASEVLTMRRRVRLLFIGWGAINSRVGALLRQRGTPVDIVAIATIDTPEARAALPEGIPYLGSTDDLAALKPDLVVEAAGRAAIAQWAP